MGSSVPPISPGPGGPALVVMPNTGQPVRSATEAATAAALARIDQTGSAIPAEHHSHTQPRVMAGQGAPSGQFALGDAVRELPAGDPAAPSAPPAPAPDAGQAPPAPVPGAPGTEGTPPAGPPGDGQQADEPADGEPNELVVTIAGRQPGEEFEIEAGDAETAERLRQLSNAALRGDQARSIEQSAREALDQADQVRARINYDPAGFLIDDVLPENPQAVDDVVLAALAQPEVWRRLAPRIDKMITDAVEYRTVTAEVRATRAEKRVEASTRMAENRAVQENYGQVRDAVLAIIPASTPAAIREIVGRDMFRALQQHALSRNMLTLPVSDIPTILAGHLTALGETVEGATQKIAEVGQRRTNGRLGSPAPRAATPPAPVSGGKSPAAPATPPSGKTFVASAAKRREVAGITPAGAGSPGGSPGTFLPINPDGSKMGVEQALAAHRARVAKGQRSY